MPWPTPVPGDISNRGAAIYEQALPGIDARNPNTVATTNTRITEMAMQDLYFFQSDVALELMVDTAVANLPRHAAIWGVPRVQPSVALGNVVINVLAACTIPAGIALSYSGSAVTYISTAAVVVAAPGAASIPVVASAAGSAGNLAPGSILTLTSPQANVSPLTGTVDSNGITGGADLQSLAAWRAAIIAQIQSEPAGGSAADYVAWALAALPNVALAACPAGASGGGVVSVVIAMTGLVAPTSGQLAAVQAYINARRPVTANVTVYGVVLNPVNVTLHVSPNTAAVQAAALAALKLSFAQDAAIGGTTYVTRLDAAISSSDGEVYHEMAAPAADVAAPTLFSLNVLGAVTFT
jgi:uncharacterized phage protein gp47/JayE